MTTTVTSKCHAGHILNSNTHTHNVSISLALVKLHKRRFFFWQYFLQKYKTNGKQNKKFFWLTLSLTIHIHNICLGKVSFLSFFSGFLKISQNCMRNRNFFSFFWELTFCRYDDYDDDDDDDDIESSKDFFFLSFFESEFSQNLDK